MPLQSSLHVPGLCVARRWSAEGTTLSDGFRPCIQENGRDQAAYKGLVDARLAVAATDTRRRGRHDRNVERAGGEPGRARSSSRTRLERGGELHLVVVSPA